MNHEVESAVRSLVFQDLISMNLICPAHYYWAGLSKILRNTIGPRFAARGIDPFKS